MVKQEHTDQLTSLYKKTFEKSGFPSGDYFEIRPTIPWVGKYCDERHILIYASAENLSKNWIGENTTIFESECAFNRHSEFWKAHNRKIRVEPFDSGGLRLAAVMCLKKLGFAMPSADNVEEYVAVANISKFSRTRDKENHNRDVSRKDLRASLNYIGIDIKFLKPKIVINASGKKNLSFLENFLCLSNLSSRVIDLPQYTHKQFGFHHLRKSVMDFEVQEFRPILTVLIEKYRATLGDIEKKITAGRIKSDDFIRYFCLLRRGLNETL